MSTHPPRNRKSPSKVQFVRTNPWSQMTARKSASPWNRQSLKSAHATNFASQNDTRSRKWQPLICTFPRNSAWAAVNLPFTVHRNICPRLTTHPPRSSPFAKVVGFVLMTLSRVQPTNETSSANVAASNSGCVSVQLRNRTGSANSPRNFSRRIFAFSTGFPARMRSSAACGVISAFAGAGSSGRMSGVATIVLVSSTSDMASSKSKISPQRHKVPQSSTEKNVDRITGFERIFES